MWINVSSTELNHVDIFAFVNMQTEEVVKGRIVEQSDGTRAVLALNNSGEAIQLVQYPEWAIIQHEEIVMRMMFEALGKLPGGDMANKLHNIQHGNYSDEQIGTVMQDVIKVCTTMPNVVILKYVPDLTITKSMMKNFEF